MPMSLSDWTGEPAPEPAPASPAPAPDTTPARAVTFATVTAALELLGVVDHRDVALVRIDPHEVIVVRHKRNEAGYRYVGPGGAVAIDVEVLPITYAEQGADSEHH